MPFRERSRLEALGRLVGSAALGFAVPAIFSGVLELQRNLFLFPLALLKERFFVSFSGEPSKIFAHS